jgi:hypothetical protein
MSTRTRGTTNTGDTGDIADLLAELWAGRAPVARGKVEVLAQYAAALTVGTDEPGLRSAARSAAHQLAGSLGSYGRGGSASSYALETLLRADGTPDAAEVSGLVREIRAAVEA